MAGWLAPDAVSPGGCFELLLKRVTAHTLSAVLSLVLVFVYIVFVYLY